MRSTVVVPPLLSLVKRRAWRALALGGLLLFGSIPFFVVAIFFGVIAFIALFMLVAGIVMVVIGLRPLIFPLSHPAFLALGRTDAERAARIREIEMELESSDVWHSRLGRGSDVFISPNWVVHYDDSDLGIVRRDDVVWICEFKKESFGGSSPAVLLCTRWPVAPSAIEIGPLDGWLLGTLTEAMPFAFVGLHLNLGRVPRHELAAHVDARRYAATGR
jgi:hypothetical protein